MTSVYIDVAVPVPLRQTFTYTHDSPLPAGVRVSVPFGNRKLIGVVVGMLTEVADTSRLKAVAAVLDEQPVLDATQLSLSRWLWQYYHHAPGEVMHTVLPVKLRKGDSATPAPQTWYRVTATGAATAADTLSRAPRQAACLQMLQAEPASQASIKAQFSMAVIKALSERALIEAYEAAAPVNDNAWLSQFKVGEKPRPDSQQAVAIAAIHQQAGKFAPFLLEGVTGSGKTEVYLQAIEDVLAAGQQVLILVPEIGLTPQTVARFTRRFGIEVAVLHSQITDAARLQVWHQARHGEIGIVIGTRSAIFTPLKRPGMIIVDEEHDESFKQQDGLRYHARDLAVMRASTEHIPLVLGSATPSLETLNNALSQRYQHLQLTQRAAGAVATMQHLLDVRDQPMRFGLAEGTLTLMRQHLSQGNQVLVFVNRRGYAPALLCHHCGHTETCRRCERPYTVHCAQQRLQCHHCGATRPMPTRCEQCASTELVTAGIGTEQLEQGLAQLFPASAQVRIDSDSIRGKDKLQTILDDINKQAFQLLIGTQILSKGHHFPHVTLVVVVDCDGALFSGDYRAPEKLAQLVTQLAGRAGRASKPGEMWLQTHNPQHPLLQDLVNNGYAHFARHALLERKMAQLPPFCAQVIIRAEAMEGDVAWRFLTDSQQRLAHQHVTLIGPMPSLIEKRQGRFRFMLVLQSSRRKVLHEHLRLSLPVITALPDAAKVRWSVDVDPTDFS
ncbi:primosomal protein N' [Salinimonas sediminis]|uniref:Replication restart protein PriA n=1 Tax=Salinimonas sediminis TaxID=2303538 RepID=A0A346NQY1_9ALTE|nr:primosomal protein N' [Salinimonas sediminis]AXR07938.1 primosomal protein N' [Salinimonas sediminis]